MDAPPEHEDSRPFLAIAAHLRGLGFSAPDVLATDMDKGLILLEDFGDARVNPLLEREPGLERGIYERAIDLLVDLHRSTPDTVPAYEPDVPNREAELLNEWYATQLGASVACGTLHRQRGEKGKGGSG